MIDPFMLGKHDYYVYTVKGLPVDNPFYKDFPSNNYHEWERGFDCAVFERDKRYMKMSKDELDLEFFGNNSANTDINLVLLKNAYEKYKADETPENLTNFMQTVSSFIINKTNNII